jgi:hypothetical protein
MGEIGNEYRILLMKSMQRGHFKKQNGEGRILLRWILWKHVVKMEVRWNRLRIMSNDKFRY